MTHRLLITGAAGEVGSALRSLLPEHLGGQFSILRLTDNRDLGEAQAGEELAPADLTDFDAVLKVMQGVDAVIHLGGIADEDTYANIRAVNMDGTYNVLEAARQAGVRRVAFASSIHTVGFYPRSETISPTVPVRPDTYYGVSKVFGEALGRMYWERYGLEFVGVRICSFQPRPKDRRHLSTWLSPRDAAQLFARAVTALDVGFWSWRASVAIPAAGCRLKAGTCWATCHRTMPKPTPPRSSTFTAMSRTSPSSGRAGFLWMRRMWGGRGSEHSVSTRGS